MERPRSRIGPVTSAPAVELAGVSKWLGSTLAVDSVEATFGIGATALVGVNGAGKSTLLRLAAGLLSPSSGTVRVMGHDMADRRSRDRASARIGLSTEEPAVDDRLTVAEQLTLHQRLRGSSAEAAARRTDDVLDLLGLTASAGKMGAQLSRGNRQRVALARAVAHGPSVLLLDEPTSNLDPVAAEAVTGWMRAEGERACVVVATHKLDEALRLGGSVALMSAGRIIEHRPLDTSDLDGERRRLLDALALAQKESLVPS